MTSEALDAGELAPVASAAPARRRRRFALGARWRAGVAALRPRWLTDDVVRGLRWGAVGVWAFAFGRQCSVAGLPLFRSDLLVWIAGLLFALSIGRRSVAAVVVDFLPFAAVLVAYDYLRGISDTLGMPTWWHPQVNVDRFLFFGAEPTVWLQEHLKHPDSDMRWYDVVVAVCYFSFFFLPYVTAGVMWLRSRRDFYRWSLRFVVLSFLGFTFFALTPAAPPWAAARCTAAQVAAHPNNPACMYQAGVDVPGGGLLGRFTSHLPGANPWVDRISTRGFGELHLRFAGMAIRAGQGGVDAVAAVPSLHLGGTVLFVLFMWSRLSTRWRPVLVAYPLLMTFTLVYSGEHYLSDCLAGALAAFAVHLTAGRIEAWRKRRRAADTLERAPQSDHASQESTCPPTLPLQGTTPSST